MKFRTAAAALIAALMAWTANGTEAKTEKPGVWVQSQSESRGPTARVENANPFQKGNKGELVCRDGNPALNLATRKTLSSQGRERAGAVVRVDNRKSHNLKGRAPGKKQSRWLFAKEFPEQLQAEMKAGKNLKYNLWAGKREVLGSIPLKGFTRALTGMQAHCSKQADQPGPENRATWATRPMTWIMTALILGGILGGILWLRRKREDEM